MATSSPPWIAQLWSWVESNGGQCKLAELREIRPGTFSTTQGGPGRSQDAAPDPADGQTATRTLAMFLHAITPSTHRDFYRLTGERALVATHTVPPSKPIVSIPLRLLCNKLTLAPLYPAHIAQSLTSTQFISLHLALQAATTEESFPVPCGRTRLTAPREFFRPFEQSLPTRFDSLPLTWELMASSSSELRDRFEIDAADKTLHGPSQSMSADLLSCLPPSLLVRTDDVIKRFEVDWKRCKTVWDGYLATNIDETDRLRFQAFHIAWCNVNTRCLYYDLGLPLTENLTLCPIIDMINHRSSRTTQPQGRFSSFSFSSPPVASTSEESYRQGDELVFSYGAHANALLMAEYGFSLGVTNPDNNNLDVSAYIEQLLLDDPQGSVKRDLLEAEGYWGDWTIQVDSNFSDETSYPSFRTLIALRLLHIERLDRETAALQSWHDVISGLLDVVSARNEAQVEHSLLHIVSRVDDECVQMLEMCQKLMRKYARPDDDVAVSARHCLSMLHGIVECDRSTASRLRFK